MKTKVLFLGLASVLLAMLVLGCPQSTSDAPAVTPPGPTFGVKTNDTTANTMSKLGIIGTGVSSSASGIATAEISSDTTKVVITSVSAGSATITVKNTTEGQVATIAVTVNEIGVIAIGTVTPWSGAFKASMKSETVDKDTFGFTAALSETTTVVSRDTAVATAKIVTNNSLQVTPVKVGTTKITITSGEEVATIDISVDATAKVTLVVFMPNDKNAGARLELVKIITTLSNSTLVLDFGTDINADTVKAALQEKIKALSLTSGYTATVAVANPVDGGSGNWIASVTVVQDGTPANTATNNVTMAVTVAQGATAVFTVIQDKVTTNTPEVPYGTLLEPSDVKNLLQTELTAALTDETFISVLGAYTATVL